MKKKEINKEQTWVKVKSFPAWSDLLALLGVFVVATFAATLFISLITPAGSDVQGFAIFSGYLIQFGVTFVYAVMQKRFRAPGDKPLLHFSFKNVDPAITLWGLIIVVAVSIVIEPLLRFFPETYMDSLSKLMGRGGWMLITVLLVAPLLEEALFRGMIQESLTTKYGGWRGILIASFIFGVIHINPPQALNAFLVGIILGYIYYRTRSLIPVILIHAVNNAIAYFSWILAGERLASTEELVGNGTVYTVIYTIACVILLIACFSIVRVLGEDKKTKEAAERAALEGRDATAKHKKPAKTEENPAADTINKNKPL